MKRGIALILLVLLAGTAAAQTTDVQTTYTATWNESTDTYDIGEDGDRGITVVQGKTYRIEVNATGHPMFLSNDGTLAADYQDPWRNTNVTSPAGTVYATENGTITFSVPSTFGDKLYYKSGVDKDAGGRIEVLPAGGSGAGATVPPLLGTIGGVPYWLLVLSLASVGAFGYLYRESR